MTVIYESSTLKVLNTGKGKTEIAIVTFSPWAPQPSVDSSGFFSRYLDTTDFHVFHIIPAGNDWYQYKDVFVCFKSLNSYLERFEKIIVLGSSMGAYGALNFSYLVKCNYVLAISPQISISPNLVPWERRWADDSERIEFLLDNVPNNVTKSPAKKIIFFDPFNDDRKHVEHLIQDSKTFLVPVPFVGHPASYYLVETNVLVDLINSLVSGDNLSEALIAAKANIRFRRSRSLHYLSSILRSLKPHHINAKRALLQKFDTLCNERNYSGELVSKVDFVRKDLINNEALELEETKPSKNMVASFSSSDEFVSHFFTLASEIKCSVITSFYSKSIQIKDGLDDFRVFIFKIIEKECHNIPLFILNDLLLKAKLTFKQSERVGILLFRCERYEDALFVFKFLCRTWPEAAILSRHIANIYLVLGDNKLALDFSRQAFERKRELKNLILYIEVCKKCGYQDMLDTLIKFGVENYSDSTYFSRFR
ncbi:hypothetical protein Q4524_15875 [Alteromonas stellipolaris]|uniref:hypothetical protein n=1 Tax=Alteromonas stellipolaris TaxID=233316 RepID=UPI0026E2974F|nr:hypothetical protein [Alteromonas stellipolaris]MDO6540061.1 hypothetical protein [Alteromonas stellipolaris]